MRAKLAALSIFVLVGAGICSAQTGPAPSQVGFSTAYCSGFVTDQKVPDATRLVSGEQSNAKLTFARGDYVYINRGQDKGVRVGDRYTVVRAEGDPADVDWFKWQTKLMKAMGTHYIDAGPASSCQCWTENRHRGSDRFLRLHAAWRHRASVPGEAGTRATRTPPTSTISPP